MIEASYSINECWSLCRNTGKCAWFSFSKELQDCFLFETCPDLKSEKDFITSQVECEYDNYIPLEMSESKKFDLRHNKTFKNRHNYIFNKF